MIKIREIVDALEKFAPLPLQEDFDNSGLQVGLTDVQLSGALLCLDVTESVIEEARAAGCNLIVSHHPLIFHPLKSVSDATYVERCVMLAIKYGITIYACHTNLDNSKHGVSWDMAQRLGLQNIRFLATSHGLSGSGVIGEFSEIISEDRFEELVSSIFATVDIRSNGKLNRDIKTVALCGGSAAFLIDKALDSGADAYIAGEIGYHRIMGYDGQILLYETGHFESERFVPELLQKILTRTFPDIKTILSGIGNPVRYIKANIN